MLAVDWLGRLLNFATKMFILKLKNYLQYIYVPIFFFYFAMMVKIMCVYKLKIVTLEKYAIIYDKNKTHDDFFIKF